MHYGCSAEPWVKVRVPQSAHMRERLDVHRLPKDTPKAVDGGFANEDIDDPRRRLSLNAIWMPEHSWSSRLHTDLRLTKYTACPNAQMASCQSITTISEAEKNRTRVLLTPGQALTPNERA